MIPNHNIYMQKALELAARAKGETSPNPLVGAVIVKDNKIIAADYHRKAGDPHAEILALRKAGAKAKNAALYINLEPCCHTDKKTPPCTKSIIASGIKKVIVAMLDPNPKVYGKGIKELTFAGIETKVGVMETEAEKLNEAFIKFITKKEPFVILKIAQSLDGKIATVRGESRWITGQQARLYVHKMRNEVDAVLVGIGTINKDNPSLTCRIRNGRNPYRIIVDSRLQIPLTSKVLNNGDNKTIIATTNKAPIRKVDLLRKHGIKVLIIKDRGGKIRLTRRRDPVLVDLKLLMKELVRLDILSVMIEGGSAVNASAILSGIVDKVVLFIAPKIIGGADAISSFGGKSPVFLENAVKVKNIQIRKIGEDLLLEGYI